MKNPQFNHKETPGGDEGGPIGEEKGPQTPENKNKPGKKTPKFGGFPIGGGSPKPLKPQINPKPRGGETPRRGATGGGTTPPKKKGALKRRGGPPTT